MKAENVKTAKKNKSRSSIKMIMALEVIQSGLHNKNNLIFVSQS